MLGHFGGAGIVQRWLRTGEEYYARGGWASEDPAEIALLAEEEFGRWLDKDILAEVFEGTKVADRFVEVID